ncbi:MAG: phosphotransferase [Chloroflexota bacterium]
MLTRPKISDRRIVARLGERFGLRIAQVAFLPIGADVRSAAFRVTTDAGRRYFLKLRRGAFDEIAAAVPAFLRAQGIRRVIAPIATTTGQLWERVDGFTWLVYPYVEGSNGFETALSRAQWIGLGESLRAIHAAVLPAELAARVPREDDAPRWRKRVLAFNQSVGGNAPIDPIAARLAAFWAAKRGEIGSIVERAERLAQMSRGRARDFVICHGDLHGRNVLVGADDELTIVDWDEPILAPKERDLMFVGGGVGGVWSQAREVAWFYEGYGPVEVDPVALAYYRNERIVADLAAYADQILGARGSAEDREEGLRQVISQFRPGGVVEIARRSYPG